MTSRLARARAALLLLALGACARVAPPPPLVPGTVIHVLSVNDVYVADTLRDGSGGVARLPVIRRVYGHGEPVLFVLAGDVLSPSLLSKWYAGRQMVDAFNAVALDYATFGNHEFDLKRDTLIARIHDSHFAWISANCTLADGVRFPGVAPWDTISLGGVRVGIFGLTLPEAEYPKWVRCTDPDSAAHRAILALTGVGAQLIVALTHQTVDADSALLAREPKLDLVLGGHEHEWHRVDIDGRLVLKADADARTAQFATLTRTDSAWHEEARLDTLDTRVGFESAAQRVVEGWQDTLRRRLGPERVVGAFAAPIDGRDAMSRRRETSLGDLVTDAMRLGTGSDAAIINSGTMRLDDIIRAGQVSNWMLESIFLFADETHVLTFPISGARLRDLLEHSVSDSVYGHGGFLQVSGIAFSYDPSRPSGDRVTELARANGRPIAPSDTLELAFNWYPACTGGDGYAVPEAKAACEHPERGPRAVDLLIAHIAKNLDGVVDPPDSGRITRVGEDSTAQQKTPR